MGDVVDLIARIVTVENLITSYGGSRERAPDYNYAST